MKIGIYGAGAIGAYLAVPLALAGHEVTCIARGAHLAAMNANGIRLRDGGGEEKPVGLVWVAVVGPEGSDARDFVFPFDREPHRRVTTQVGLDWVRRLLLGEDPLAPRYMQRPQAAQGAARSEPKASEVQKDGR